MPRSGLRVNRGEAVGLGFAAAQAAHLALCRRRHAAEDTLEVRNALFVVEEILAVGRTRGVDGGRGSRPSAGRRVEGGLTFLNL